MHLATSVDNKALFAELKDRYLATLPDYKAPDLDKQIKVGREGGREGGRGGREGRRVGEFLFARS